jgi:hypothetical protein
VGDAGLDLSLDSSLDKRQSPDSAAESGAVSTESLLADADLVAVVKAWPMLPKATGDTS